MSDQKPAPKPICGASASPMAKAALLDDDEVDELIEKKQKAEAQR